MSNLTYTLSLVSNERDITKLNSKNTKIYKQYSSGTKTEQFGKIPGHEIKKYLKDFRDDMERYGQIFVKQEQVFNEEAAKRTDELKSSVNSDINRVPVGGRIIEGFIFTEKMLDNGLRFEILAKNLWVKPSYTQDVSKAKEIYEIVKEFSDIVHQYHCICNKHLRTIKYNGVYTLEMINDKLELVDRSTKRIVNDNDAVDREKVINTIICVCNYKDDLLNGGIAKTKRKLVGTKHFKSITLRTKFFKIDEKTSGSLLEVSNVETSQEANAIVKEIIRFFSTENQLADELPRSQEVRKSA